VIFKIPKFITIKGIYPVGFGFSNILLAALNIASGGFFWWHEPKNLSTFFESLVDTEDKMTGGIGRNPELKLGWPPAVLDEPILDKPVALFTIMPQPFQPREDAEVFSAYMTGIALLAKTDVFLQFEIQSYGSFLAAVKSALRIYRDELGSEFPPDMATLLSSLGSDDAFKKKHGELITQFEAHTLQQGAITLSEVAEMKRLSEGLITHALLKRLDKRAQQAGDGNKEDAD
jgi:hypothetical protein